MLPKKIDRNKTYYKITNAEECHYGLQYRTGLNIDPVPFNNDPARSCCKGGIYFTTAEFIHKYFWKGCWIREVTIPEDAQVVLDPMRNKYRTDKIILGKRYNFDWYFNNFFDKKTFPKEDFWFLIVHCLRYFDKWFDKKIFPIECYNLLAKFCSDHFTEWFDKETFLAEDNWYLREYCKKYKHIWGN